MRADVADALDWSVAELASGDAVCIDGLAPHYSETNRGATPRRVLVASYAPVRADHTREHYYRATERAHAARDERDGRFRISTLADFDGAEVATDAATDTAAPTRSGSLVRRRVPVPEVVGIAPRLHGGVASVERSSLLGLIQN